MNIALIVFLGNKGATYSKTRHNAGWLLYEECFSESSDTLREKFHGLHGSMTCAGKTMRMLFPHTYMNESGRSVSAMLSYFSISSEETLIVHDDIELPFGALTLQMGGSASGHNGLRSIFRLCGTTDFLRLRIGVGRGRGGDVASHVLSRFSQDEEPFLPQLFRQGEIMIQRSVSGTIEEKGLPFSQRVL